LFLEVGLGDPRVAPAPGAPTSQPAERVVEDWDRTAIRQHGACNHRDDLLLQPGALLVAAVQSPLVGNAA